MTQIFLIRHGQTDNPENRIFGRTKGVFLNYTGLSQAQNLADKLKDVQIDEIYSSPMERTLETAAPLAKNLNLQVQPSDAFLEIDYGTWSNRKVEELRNDPAFIYYHNFRSSAQIPGGETISKAQLRAATAIENIRIIHSNKKVAIFSHADVIKAVVAFYAGIHLDLFSRIEISNASVSIINFFEDAVRVLCVNRTVDIAG